MSVLAMAFGATSHGRDGDDLLGVKIKLVAVYSECSWFECKNQGRQHIIVIMTIVRVLQELQDAMRRIVVQLRGDPAGISSIQSKMLVTLTSEVS
jgi:hypothetical protein